jgi:hypothetical protein
MKEPQHLYVMRCPIVKKICIPPNVTSFRETFIGSGQVPARVVVGFLSQAASEGSYVSNPFNYHHYRVRQVQIQVNEKFYPAQEVNRWSFTTLGQYLKAYQLTCDSLGKFQTNNPLAITYEEFGAGYSLFAFDLTKEHQASRLDVQRQSGSVTLVVEFEAANQHPFYATVYEDYVKELSLDRFGNPTGPI